MGSFIAELKRRNIFKVGVVYAIVAWLLIVVVATVFPIPALPDWSIRLFTIVIIIGFPIAVFLARAYELTPESIKPTRTSLPAENIPQIANQVTEPQGTTGPVLNTLAVMPFTNLSHDPEQKYFADGLTEELLNKSARVVGTLFNIHIKTINTSGGENMRRLRIPFTASVILILFFLVLRVSCAETLVVDDKAIADETRTSDWLAYGRTHNERRFSPLTDINTDNVADLKVDWFLDLPKDVGLISTPLVVDGVMYFNGSMNIVRAVDAVTGKLIWEFDPETGKHISKRKPVGWSHNRGISFYEGKVFNATWDGRLIAIDAKTGKEIWTAVTFDPNRALYITGAPKAFKGKVLIGNGGTENGPARGYVSAYDADTGKLAWRFYIVPGNPADGFENKAMEMAAKTWTGEWWKHGGGGNAWHGFTYDPDFDAVYIGTGNGSPWNRKIRSPGGGDNLFLCSIVALDPDTGEYRWHYQTTPGETWDYNSNMDIVLADLTIDGKPVKAILHAPKNGFFYVINRANGKLISAQPIVETSWATHIDMATGRPVETPGARYENAPFDLMPSPWGAHNWQAMSYSPLTGLAYIPTHHEATRFSDEGIDLKRFQSVEFIGGTGANVLAAEKQPRDYPASLLAWDPVKQEQAWEIPQDTFWNAGTLTTAGNLVFQGRADGKLLAYDATTGAIKWTFDAGLGISAPPITYKLNGRQYLAILVGFGGGYSALGGQALGWAYRVHTRRLVAFSLQGRKELPKQPPPYIPKPIAAPDFAVNETLSGQGAMLYLSCATCHGFDVIAAGMAPDLRASPVPLDMATFTATVRDGTRADMGMPPYRDLTDEQLQALMHYIRKRANESL